MALNSVSRWIQQPANFFGLQIAKAQATVRGQLYLEPMSARPTDDTNEGAVAWDDAAGGLVQNDGTVYRALSDRHLIRHNMPLNADCVDQSFFIADRAYKVKAIYEIHATAGNDAGAVNVQVTKDTGTDAPGAGTDLLTNNTNAGFNMKGTANTLQTGTLTATAASLLLAAGDRLSVDFAGVVTTLAGVSVQVVLEQV